MRTREAGTKVCPFAGPTNVRLAWRMRGYAIKHLSIVSPTMNEFIDKQPCVF